MVLTFRGTRASFLEKIKMNKKRIGRKTFRCLQHQPRLLLPTAVGCTSHMTHLLPTCRAGNCVPGPEKVLRDDQRAVAQMRMTQTSQGERIPINSQSLNYWEVFYRKIPVFPVALTRVGSCHAVECLISKWYSRESSPPRSRPRRKVSLMPTVLETELRRRISLCESAGTRSTNTQPQYLLGSGLPSGRSCDEQHSCGFCLCVADSPAGEATGPVLCEWLSKALGTQLHA